MLIGISFMGFEFFSILVITAYIFFMILISQDVVTLIGDPEEEMYSRN